MKTRTPYIFTDINKERKPMGWEKYLQISDNSAIYTALQKKIQQ